MSETSIEKTKRIAEEAAERAKKDKEQAKTSAIPSKLGKIKTVKINKGKKTAYDLTLRFPGTRTALHVVEDSRGVNSQIMQSDLIENAIAEDVIVQPKELAENGLDFFDNHDGALEVAAQLGQFLTEELL